MLGSPGWARVSASASPKPKLLKSDGGPLEDIGDEAPRGGLHRGLLGDSARQRSLSSQELEDGLYGADVGRHGALAIHPVRGYQALRATVHELTLRFPPIYARTSYDLYR